MSVGGTADAVAPKPRRGRSPRHRHVTHERLSPVAPAVARRVAHRLKAVQKGGSAQGRVAAEGIPHRVIILHAQRGRHCDGRIAGTAAAG